MTIFFLLYSHYLFLAVAQHDLLSQGEECASLENLKSVLQDFIPI